MALENYVPVPVRIAKFKKDHNGEGSITTESFINYEKEVASFKATIKVGDKVIATGHSLVGDLADDKAFEKGETTAIGRALVHAGYEAESLEYDEDNGSSSKSSKSSKKSGLGKGLGSSKKASKVEEVEEEETEEEETEEEEAPKKKATGLPSIGKSSKKKVAKDEEDEEEEESEEEESEEEAEEESEEETEEEEAPKKKASKGGSSKLDNVMAKYGLK